MNCYPNSEMISTYAGYTGEEHCHCTVVLRDDEIVVEYMDGSARITYHGRMTEHGHFILQHDEDGYRYSATLRRTAEDLLEGKWQTNRPGATYSNGTWSIELG